jgi:Effector Associated Constant Component 1
VEATFSVDSTDPQGALAELEDWLRHEPELRGRVAAVRRPPRPGELGAPMDLLSVALGGGGALTALAASLRGFFAQTRRSDLRIVVKAADGSSVEIDAKRVKNAEASIAEVLGRIE